MTDAAGLRSLCGECGATVDIPNPLAAPPSEALRDKVLDAIEALEPRKPGPTGHGAGWFYDGFTEARVAARTLVADLLASSDRDASPATPPIRCSDCSCCDTDRVFGVCGACSVNETCETCLREDASPATPDARPLDQDYRVCSHGVGIRAATPDASALRTALARCVEEGWMAGSVDHLLYQTDPLYHAIVYSMRQAMGARSIKNDCTCSSGKYGGSHTADCALRRAEREAQLRAALASGDTEPGR